MKDIFWAYSSMSSVDLISPYLVSTAEQRLSGMILWYLLSSLPPSKLSSYSECRLALAQTPDCYQLFLELLSKHHQKQVSPPASSGVCLCLCVYACVCRVYWKLFQRLWSPLSVFTLRASLFMNHKSKHIDRTLCPSACLCLFFCPAVRVCVLTFNQRRRGW